MNKLLVIRQLDGSEDKLNKTDLPLILGTEEEAHIVLPSADSPVAFIGDEQGHLFIQPSSPDDTPVFLNDTIITSSSWLKSGDTITCHDMRILFNVSGDIITFTVIDSTRSTDNHSLVLPQKPTATRKDFTNGSDIPVNIIEKKPFSTRMKLLTAAVSLTFLLLGLVSIFILLARPLSLNVTPEPDSVSISGFPPSLKFAREYLLLPGTYSIKITKQGYYPFEQSLTIDRKTHTIVTAVLEKLPGILLLDLLPANGVTVYSNNRVIGVTPPHSFELVPGKHRLKLEKERYQPFSTDLVIQGAHVRQTVNAKLKPDTAEITIETNPSQASVSVDGKLLGQTPVTVEMLSGNRELSIRKTRYSEVKTSIKVRAEATETHFFEMELLPGQLTVTAAPSNSAIIIDDTYRGTTPLTIALSSGLQHKLTLHAQGYKSVSQTISLAPAEKKTVNFNLEQEQGIIYLITHPPDASVSINGKRYSSSQGKFSLPVQQLTCTVSAPGYKEVTRTILPKAGFSQQITINLEPRNESARAYSSSVPVKPRRITTAADQEMIRVEPSQFTMGAPRREPGRRANERERTVSMKRAFYLSPKPVTNEDFRQFKKDHSSGIVNGHTLDSDKQPVVNIRWEEAVAYLNWLSRKEGLQPFYIARNETFIATSPPTNGYRLPTEAEWAFAARIAGNAQKLKFPWGSTFPPRQISGNYADESARGILPQIIKGYNDGFIVSSPVGSFKANSGGFYDMDGNISEWCHDFYSAYTNTLSDARDPTGPANGLHHVVRGASWRDATIKEMRLSYRSYSRTKEDTIGFRVARYQ